MSITGARKSFECEKVLKACVYLLSNFYFSPSDSSLKTIKNVFCFIQKALLVLEIFTF